MNPIDLKEAIKRRVRLGGVSFVELARDIPSAFGGNVVLGGFETLVVWTGLSKDGAEAVLSLVQTGEIHMTPTSMLVYAIDGRLLNLPIAKRVQSYKRLHWLPVVFNPGPVAPVKRGAAR